MFTHFEKNSHYSLVCETYKSNIFTGLTRLQEDQEFVDLTLAADGHLVKVHKNVIALASPYLKEMVQSASGLHPIIFLNNVSHQVLSYILGYIYQGEVGVPEEHIDSFIQASKALHITGINQLIAPMKQSNHRVMRCNVQKTPAQPVQQREQQAEERLSNFAASIKIGNDNNMEVVQQLITDTTPVVIEDNSPLIEPSTTFTLPITTQDQQIVINHNLAEGNIPNLANLSDLGNINVNQAGTMDIESIYPANEVTVPSINRRSRRHANTKCAQVEQIQLRPLDKNDAEAQNLEATQPLSLDTLDKNDLEALKILSQFSLTERGSIQLIMNRYIYLCQYSSLRGRKRRWRCSDYRRFRCPAFIDSLDGVLVKRNGVHSHPYHDEKIYKKHKKGLIFNSIETAEEAIEEL